MLTTNAVGIDLGTTYSCIATINEHGQPISIPNREGEYSTPSAVFFDRGEIVVGMEAIRNSILHPHRVIQHAKRFMGDPEHHWKIDGKIYTPNDISALIVKSLLADASLKIGPVTRAVITVPAQFSDSQRRATIQAGRQAGLEQIDIINEPVAAALCYVLGKEGLWFSELSNEQKLLVYDLGGGTFDLSIVRYTKNEVKVIASGGDLHLGGLDWNQALLNFVAGQFTNDLGEDPRNDPESLQALWLEVEQCKRSLSVRPRAALVCLHAGKRKTYQIELEKFNEITEPLLRKTEEITRRLLKDNKMGWAHIDVVLMTGGASRMQATRQMLKKMSGRTLNDSLSPDQSIAHGAAYYAGMILSNSEYASSLLTPEAQQRLGQIRQQSVNARGLGILVRDPEKNVRFPHYLIPANTPLPAAVTQTFGTVIPNQKRVHLMIIESGANLEDPPLQIGDCVVEGLPENLPVDSEIAVTISYDASAKIQVSARETATGKQASVEILRQENMAKRIVDPVSNEAPKKQTSAPKPASASKPVQSKLPVSSKHPQQKSPVKPTSVKPTGPASGKPQGVDRAEVPIPLCNRCGEPMANGRCSNEFCFEPTVKGAKSKAPDKPRSGVIPILPMDEDEIIDLVGEENEIELNKKVTKELPKVSRGQPLSVNKTQVPRGDGQPAVKPKPKGVSARPVPPAQLPKPKKITPPRAFWEE